ncbi:unnamed protein product [Callosobruchus maculatus]|uniref:Nicotinate phosphoribosyltransferase N-terminal domain-containing protein n=1 Tax=Callosobruchus maculatus TaxID=64391 RepID=A0A653CMD1_CALMS|nr:unnamed protein product [Callosobruchus maculatus]
MAYAYWKSGKTKDHAVFDLFFRKNPFQGEFTIFAGLEECLKFLNKFHYSDSDIAYLRDTLPASTKKNFSSISELLMPVILDYTQRLKDM